MFSYVRLLPADYNADFITQQSGGVHWTAVDTGPDETGVLRTQFVFVFEDNLSEAALDDVILNYDAKYTAWARPEYLKKVELRMYKEFMGGFTVPVGVGGPLAGKNLQTRSVEDRTNWLTSQAAYSSQISASNGAVAGASVRTTDNKTVVCTYSEGHTALLMMADWGSKIMKRSWILKDQLIAATTPAALDTIIADLENGWPSSPTA